MHRSCAGEEMHLDPSPTPPPRLFRPPLQQWFLAGSAKCIVHPHIQIQVHPKTQILYVLLTQIHCKSDAEIVAALGKTKQ